MEKPTSFKQSLGLLDSTMIVAGGMIGSGIFIVSADMLRTLGSAQLLLAAWILTCILTLIVGLCLGELGAMMPKAGGQYVYLREAYGPLTGFLFGWSQFLVVQAGYVAAVAVAFAKFTAVFFPIFSAESIWLHLGPIDITGQRVLAIVSVFITTMIHTRGVEGGKNLQTILTIVKIAALAGLILLGVFSGFKTELWNANLQNPLPEHPLNGVSWLNFGVFAALATALTGSLFASDVCFVTFIAGEIKNPKRNLPLSLLIGTVMVCALYLLVNVVYLGTLSLDQIAHASNDRVGTASMGAMFGVVGTAIMAAFIMISTFGCNTGLILTGARIGYALSNDGLFFKKASELNKNSVPEWALWMQFFWVCLLCLSGSYGSLLDYLVSIQLIFYALTVAAIFVLRIKKPDAERPYRAWGYPILPAFYILSATFIAAMLVIYKWENTRWGLVVLLLGVPFYFLQKRKV
jgi:basic amino acid/polyamine antiporter, APA family